MSDGPEYHDLFIAVAEDCPTTSAVVPTPFRGRETVATIQYDLLATEPYRWRQSDVLFRTWATQQGLHLDEADDAGAPERAEYFATSRACLRSSPLGKKYGWGIHFDADGRAALYGVGSPEYEALTAGDGPKVVRAMRSRRA